MISALQMYTLNTSAYIKNNVLIEELIGVIDRRINCLINQVFHHPRFQLLEASWRGLALMTQCASKDKRVKLKILNITTSELSKDILSASEPDQSNLFRRIYTEELDTPGGDPFGLIVADFYFSHKPEGGIKDSPSILKGLGQICSASFCPVIAGASASLLGLDNFADYPIHSDLDSLFKQSEYSRWNSIRHNEDLRFVNLALPRFQIRKGYNFDGVYQSYRYFREENNDKKNILWANAAYLVGCSAINCFIDTGWFGALKGFELSTEPTSHPFIYRPAHQTDPTDSIYKVITELQITDNIERDLTHAGLICLKDNPWLGITAIYDCPSVHSANHYTKSIATTNAKISSMLHYVLCVSRFSHYIKAIVRDKVGSFMGAQDCQEKLNKWLMQYTNASSDSSSTILAKYPLNEARVEIRSKPGIAGKFNGIIHIKPHYQLDSMSSHLKLVTDIKLN